MKHIIENLTRRPVTLMGNSGKYYHLPPRYKFEVAELEVTGNAFAQKLEQRNVLAIREAGAESKKSGIKDSTKVKIDADKVEPKTDIAAKSKRPQ